jgi:beta-amylase
MFHFLFWSFQCYDRYLMTSLKNAAEERGHSFWGKGPDNAGTYNSRPQDTGFFCDGGDYDGYYGRFFLGWYSKVLVDHADHVLMLANLAFEGSSIAAKVRSAAFLHISSNKFTLYLLLC